MLLPLDFALGLLFFSGVAVVVVVVVAVAVVVVDFSAAFCASSAFSSPILASIIDDELSVISTGSLTIGSISFESSVSAGCWTVGVTLATELVITVSDWVVVVSDGPAAVGAATAGVDAGVGVIVGDAMCVVVGTGAAFATILAQDIAAGLADIGLIGSAFGLGGGGGGVDLAGESVLEVLLLEVEVFGGVAGLMGVLGLEEATLEVVVGVFAEVVTGGEVFF